MSGGFWLGEEQFYSSSRTVPFGHSCRRAEWTDEGGGFDPPRWIAPLHLHRNDDEAWYVLEACCACSAAMRWRRFGWERRCWCRRGRRTPTDVTRYLLAITPRILQLIEAIHAM
jgi:hypothetical protein